MFFRQIQTSLSVNFIQTGPGFEHKPIPFIIGQDFNDQDRPKVDRAAPGFWPAQATNTPTQDLCGFRCISCLSVRKLISMRKSSVLRISKFWGGLYLKILKTEDFCWPKFLNDFALSNAALSNTEGFGLPNVAQMCITANATLFQPNNLRFQLPFFFFF